MKIIDAHTHFYPTFAARSPEAWAESVGEAYWKTLVGARADGKRSLQGFPSEEKFLRDMDAAGVERAIIQGWYWERHETCALMNAEISKLLRRRPDRFSAFASVQPADPRAEEIAKEAKEAGFCGLGEIHDGVQKFSYLGKSFESLAIAAREARLPLCLHITENSPRVYHGKVETDTAAAIAAARKFSGVNFIFAHWCGCGIFSDAERLKALPNAYVDSAASPLISGESAWKAAAEKFPDRALYGSDYPLRLYPRKFKIEEMLTIADEARAHVPQQTAERFFSKNISNIISIS